MVDDFFLGFTGHAHTRNDLEADPAKDLQLRKENSVEEVQRLTEAVLDKLGKDISDAGHGFEEVKLLVLYLSYRGETEEKDRLISESVLRVIEKRFTGKTAAEQLPLIGHTTAGEIENEDLELEEVSGIGYNGLSLLALVTNLSIGVGRTLSIRTEKDAAEQGKEMTRDAWVDFNQSTEAKEHLQKSKTLLVLAKGPSIGKAGYEYFMTTGIADFVRSAREARIANVIGGCSGDGIIGQSTHQFYGKIGRQSELKILENAAVCALIPNLAEPSLGLDVSPVRRIGESYTFHFDPDAEPKFKFLKRIGDEDPRKVHARIICENEALISREMGLPVTNEKEFFQQISEIDGIPLNLTLAKYAFAFPFGNYAPANLLRVHGQTVELLQPVRSHDPSIPGYIVVIDHEKVQKGARNVFDMLRENRGFKERDTTFIVTCISRRLAEMVAGCRLNTESEIFKEALSSTQVIGFLAYGEVSFTHLLQEPYVYNFSCWGMTLRSLEDGKQGKHGKSADVALKKKRFVQRQEDLDGEVDVKRCRSGYADLDKLLCGGLRSGSAVVLTSPSCDERSLLIKTFLETGAKNGEATFYVTIDPGALRGLAEEFQSNFFLLVCNPQADAIVRDLPNVFKVKGVANLTEIGIVLTSAISRMDSSLKGSGRICIDLISDILLQHNAVQTRRCLSALIPGLRSAGFTLLAVTDPEMHSPQEVHAVLDLFEGEINILEKGADHFLKIKRMSDQEYLEDGLLLKKGDLQRKK